MKLYQIDPTPEPPTPYIPWPTPTPLPEATPLMDLQVELYAPQFAEGVEFYVNLYANLNTFGVLNLFIIALELVILTRGMVTVIKRIEKSLLQ